MPKWFARLFALVMVLACFATAWYAYQHETLSFAIEDVRVSLETSQARERKQQYEYDQVSKALPETVLELNEIQPKADAAKAEETELREKRKALRATVSELTSQLEEAEARMLEAEKALKEQLEALEALSSRMDGSLSRSLATLYASLPGTADVTEMPASDGTAETVPENTDGRDLP